MALVSSLTPASAIQSRVVPRSRIATRSALAVSDARSIRLGGGAISVSFAAPRRTGTVRRSARLAASAASSSGPDDVSAQQPRKNTTFDPLCITESPGASFSSTEEKQQQEWWRVALQRAKAPVLALAICLVMLAAPLNAMAARSGGRMGGGSFRASAPAPSMSRSGGGVGGGGLMSPGLTSRSIFMPVPMGMGYGYGMGMGGGMGMGMGMGMGGFANVMMFAVLVFFFMNMFGGGNNNNNNGGGLQFGGGDRITVVKIQIGLLGLARQLQLDLEEIADKADTSDPEGLHYVLEETVLALLRNPEYCVYGFAESKSAGDPDEAEELFNEMSMDERGKIDNETLVNVNDRKRATKAKVGGDGEDQNINEYILVTIIAASDGNIKIPKVMDGSELRTALKRLGAIRVDALQAVEVLWTPQEDGDTLTEEELLTDYPQLNVL